MSAGICQVCGRFRAEVHHSRKIDRDVCRWCHRDLFQPRDVCSSCGKIRIVALRTEEGKAICVTCYDYPGKKREAFRPEATCGRCGEKRVINAHDANGLPVCVSCYPKELRLKAICSRCGTDAVVAKYDDVTKAPICHSCYYKNYRRKIHIGVCSGCGQEKKILILSKMICQNCYVQGKKKTQISG